MSYRKIELTPIFSNPTPQELRSLTREIVVLSQAQDQNMIFYADTGMALLTAGLTAVLASKGEFKMALAAGAACLATSFLAGRDLKHISRLAMPSLTSD